MKKWLVFLCICCCFFAESALGKPVYVRSVPKSGTYLVDSAIHLLGLKDCYSGHFVVNRNIVPPDQNDETTVVLIRDLRDSSVSAVFWMDRVVKKFLSRGQKPEGLNCPRPDVKKYQSWLQLSFEEKLTAVIEMDLSKLICNRDPMEHIRVADYCIKRGYPVIYFHNLVGEQGGGSRKRQRAELQKLICITGQHVSPDRLENTLDNLWGKGKTFRDSKKKIGIWKDYFTEEHKRLFKERWNQYLLEWGYETNPNW